MQIAGEEIKQQSIITNDWLRRIYDDIASNTEIPDLAQQSKDITMESYRSQVNINFPTSQLDAIALDVSVLKNTVFQIQDAQIEGWGNVGEMTTNVEKISKDNPKIMNSLEIIKENSKTW